MRSYLPWTEPLIRIHKLQGEKVQVQDKNWAFPQSRCQIVNTKADKESDTWCLLEPSLSILNWNGNNLFFTIWFTQYATFWRSIYFIGKQNVSNKKADICRVVMLKHFDCSCRFSVSISFAHLHPDIFAQSCQNCLTSVRQGGDSWWTAVFKSQILTQTKVWTLTGPFLYI